MALPGKITICELEEDNPQKSYFRIRPVLIMEDGLPVDAASLQTEYGDEGGIRIVPDKNEAMHFKSRMRTLGGYCLLDLTMHPAENEKIRPNKNYSQQKGELNRNIVYSDVICACGSTEVMQVFSSAEEGKGQPAYTQRVLLKEDGILKGPYVPELTPDRMIYGFADDENGMLNAFDSGKIVDVMRGKERVSLYISNTLCEKGKTVQTAQMLDPKEESPEQDPEEIVPAAEGFHGIF